MGSLKLRVLIFLGIFANAFAQNDIGCSFDEDERHLLCHLRDLTPQQDVEMDLARTNRLTITCQQDYHSKGRTNELRSNHFGNLPFLTSLEINNCNLNSIPSRAFAGLSGLKKLSLASSNSAAMEFEKGAMDGLEGLEDLNLSNSGLWSLPEGSLCHMTKLSLLNVSGNHLTSAADLGMRGSECKTSLNIKNLDLSANSISSLRAGDLGIASANLRSLDLSSNRISILGEDALAPLASLTELDLSDNRLAALPSQLFSAASKLKLLELQHNSLSLMPAGIFEGLNNLESLNLSANALRSNLLSGETFVGLEKLQILDLSKNQLSEIGENLFDNLKQLHALDLSKNSISSVSKSAFKGPLKILNLSHNALQSFDGEVLEQTAKLESLSLDNNALNQVNLSEQSLGELTDLALNGNKLNEIPDFVKQSRALKTLDLGSNLIEDLSVNDFKSLVNLYGLRLAGNRLTKLDNDTFATSPKLHILNLAKNQLESIEVGAFSGLNELHVLRLDGNKLEDLNGLVSSLGSLRWLNVSSNSLQWFDFAFVPSSLEWLDISDNSVEELGNFYKLNNFALSTLLVSHNSLTLISADSLPLPNLKMLDLSSNRVSKVEDGSFLSLRHLDRVDLRGNRITSVARGAMLVSSSAQGTVKLLLLLLKWVLLLVQQLLLNFL